MTMLTKLVRRWRPNADFEGVSASVLARWMFHLALLPALRGLSMAARGRASFPFLRGRRVRILFAERFSAGPGLVLGDGVRIQALAVKGVTIGSRVTIREGGWIQCASSPANPGDGLVIGSDVYIGPGVILGVGGTIRIGDGCQFGANVTLIAENHAITDELELKDGAVSRRGIEIDDNCWLGHGVTVLDGVRLGPGCVVGAGSVVTKSFPALSRIAGSPARAIGS